MLFLDQRIKQISKARLAKVAVDAACGKTRRTQIAPQAQKGEQGRRAHRHCDFPRGNIHLQQRIMNMLRVQSLRLVLCWRPASCSVQVDLKGPCRRPPPETLAPAPDPHAATSFWPCGLLLATCVVAIFAILGDPRLHEVKYVHEVKYPSLDRDLTVWAHGCNPRACTIVAT